MKKLQGKPWKYKNFFPYYCRGKDSLHTEHAWKWKNKYNIKEIRAKWEAVGDGEKKFLLTDLRFLKEIEKWG